MAARDLVHRLCLESGRAALVDTPLIPLTRADRHLWPVRRSSSCSAARSGSFAAVAAAGGHRRRRCPAVARCPPRRVPPTRCRSGSPHRPAQYRPGGQMESGIRRGSRGPPRELSGAADGRAAAAVLAGSGGDRSARRTAAADARRFAAVSASRATSLLGHRPAADRRNRRTSATARRRRRRQQHLRARARRPILARYDKAHLVPYGEYLPMRPLLSAIGLSRLAPGDLDFTPGPGRARSTCRRLGQGRLPALLRNHLLRPVVDRDNRPDFIFNPSNDAWFGRWGPPQHLAQARLRAAEEGFPVIRSTPTGISALIHVHGPS